MDGSVYLIDPKYLNKVILPGGATLLQTKHDEFPTYEVTEQFLNSKENIIEISEIVESEEQQIVESGDSVYLQCGDNNPLIISQVAPGTFFETSECSLGDVTQSRSRHTSQAITLNAFQNANSTPSPAAPFRYDESLVDPLVIQAPARAAFPSGHVKWKAGGKKASSYAKERYSIYCGTGAKLCCSTKVDKLIMIPPHVFKRQLQDTTDIVGPKLSLPSTRRGMELLDWSARKVFSLPSARLCHKLASRFTRNCITTSEKNEIDPESFGLMPVGHQIPIDKSKIKQITRKRWNQYSKPVKYTWVDPRRDSSTFILPCPSPGAEDMQLLLQSEEGSCYLLEGELLLNPQRSNMELLLAAAAEDQHSLAPEEIFLCQETPPADCEASEEVILTITHLNTNSEQYILG